MILTIAVLLGLAMCLMRAWWHRQPPDPPQLEALWLVGFTFAPQLLAFRLELTRSIIPDIGAAFILVLSLSLLLLFIWRNRQQAGLWLAGWGVALNLLVIGLNGGFMPITPETVNILVPDAPPGAWTVGERFGHGKDIILPRETTTLWSLSDRFLLPVWFPFQVAFSLGDILIFLGIFWMLWEIGGSQREIQLSRAGDGDSFLLLPRK